ncbi:MAG: 2Fe-2S iron-sulfur cluster binding domain-containing protein [Gammaproteobacteria bacterium]|nr:2Fe-2S iron-sulfur cluster binding domain-containing protein [Gammaproteobacteria bacterium]
MPSIEFLSDNKKIDAEQGESILQAALRAGISHTHVCGGKARCTTCRVLIIDDTDGHLSPRCDREKLLADKFGFSSNIRLACQAKVTGDVKTRRLVIDDEDVDITLLNITEEGESFSSTGIEKSVAILFADIRDFTSFSEIQLPYDVIHMLNRYFYRMRQIIEHNHGEIFNYMGDGLLALFDADDCNVSKANSVGAALQMLDSMDKMQSYLERTYGQSLEIGIGIHAGDVVIGSIDDACNDKKMVIGDSVNFASRVESENKRLGSRLLVSESVYESLKDKLETGLTCSTELKGKQGRHGLYEVLSLDTDK